MIQIIEVATQSVHTEIKTLSQLINFLHGQVFEEDFQRRHAVQRLLLAPHSSALSLDLVWQAKFTKKIKKKQNKK